MSTLEHKKAFWNTLSPIQWVGLIAYTAIIIWILGFCPIYLNGRVSTALWLKSTWHLTPDSEHTWIAPFLSIYMLSHTCRQLKSHVPAASLHGLWSVICGAFLFVVSVRCYQPRICLAALPFLLLGGAWCYWGRDIAIRCAFPFFFLWLMIPVPGLQQATVGLQLLATKLAHWGAGICGVETVMEGTDISSVSGKWETFNIAGGCSGINSLITLLLISSAWGYLTDTFPVWKRLVLAFSAIPLAIICNALRVASIFVCAEYINPAFAAKTWHDWSGLILFFPVAILGLTALHGLLAGEISIFKRKQTRIRTGKQR